MGDRPIPRDHAEHRAMVAEAKDHLGKVSPHLRGKLARYLDLGEEPDSDFLRAVLDGDLLAIATWTNSALALGTVVLFLHNHAPSVSWGSKEKRLAWQENVSALFAEPEAETGDTEPAPAPVDEIPSLELPPVGGVVFPPDDERRFDMAAGVAGSLEEALRG